MKVAVIGTGFVGVVSAAVYASFGNTVVGIDIDESKVTSLKAGKVPFFEPDLEELLLQEQKKGSLTFTSSFEEGVSLADVIIISVGTPSKADGAVDLQFVYGASKMVGKYLKENAVVVVKSTVPPGTLDEVQKIIEKETNVSFHVASVPEFLREGTAVSDTLKPDRIVIGATKKFALDLLKELHAPLKAPVVITTPESAQMAKYTANAYLATRITFINHIADLCEHTKADVQEVIEAIGYDARIGSHYWYPGLGYGGSCFPKDVNELAHFSKTVSEDPNLFTALKDWNETRIPEKMNEIGSMVGGWQGKTVAVLGLSFKPNTNDMRVAPSLTVIPYLLDAGATVKGYDPKAKAEAAHVLVDHENLHLVDSISQACQDASVVIVLIEWPEIISHDYGQYAQKENTKYFIDTRNQFSPEKVKDWGYVYKGIGRNGR